MGSFGQASLDALHLLVSGDPELWAIIGISVRVSTTALLLDEPTANLDSESRLRAEQFLFGLKQAGLAIYGRDSTRCMPNRRFGSGWGLSSPC